MSLFRMEFNKQKILIVIVFFIGLFLLCFNEVIVALTGALETELTMWTVGYGVILPLFPLFCIVPCLYLFDEKSSGYMRMSLLRTSIKEYFKTKFIFGSAVTFLTCFLISFLGLVFCMYFIPKEMLLFMDPKYIDKDVFGYDLYSQAPLVYGFLLSTWRGIVGIIFYFFGVTLVFLTKNKFLVAIIPFVYYHLENYFWAILDVYQTRTMYSIGLESSGIQSEYFGFSIGGPLILVVILSLIYFMFIRNKIFKLIK